jgi:hypothetical protein
MKAPDLWRDISLKGVSQNEIILRPPFKGSFHSLKGHDPLKGFDPRAHPGVSEHPSGKIPIGTVLIRKTDKRS